MATTRIGKFLAGAVLLGAVSSANAAIVTVDPFAQFVNPGQEFEVTIGVAFEEATVGGALDLSYDPTLAQFVSFAFDEDFINNVADPDFSSAPEDCYNDGAAFGGCDVGDGELNAIAFGSFAGIQGIYASIATITFVALEAGTTIDLSLSINDEPFEGFISAIDASGIDVELRDAQAYVVPLPAGAWLLFSALGAMGVLRRKRS